jgi:hypothetical protein
MVNHIGHNSSQDTTELNDIITKLGLSLSGVGRVIQNYKGFKSGILDIPQVHLTPIIPVKEPEPVQDTSKITEQETLKLVQNQEKVLDDQLRSLATAIKEMVIVNEEQPKVLTEIEAQQDPIKVILGNLGRRTRTKSRSITMGIARKPRCPNR